MIRVGSQRQNRGAQQRKIGVTGRRLAAGITVLLPMVLWAASNSARLAREFQAQLDRIQAYAAGAPPHATVVLTAAGANAYLAQDPKIPAAVRDLRLSATPGALRGQAQVDFSRLPHKGAGGLAQAFFTGTHQLAVVARLNSGGAPAASVTVEEVDLDGARIPDFLLELAIREFVTPKYPHIQGRTFSLPLPAHVRRVILGRGEVTFLY
ncbi:MAG: hypothetical protein ACRD2E_11445 [Terriglobales bacterium]